MFIKTMLSPGDVRLTNTVVVLWFLHWKLN